jgi:hypothetical protein
MTKEFKTIQERCAGNGDEAFDRNKEKKMSQT